MDSLFADFLAVVGRFFEERMTATADDRARLAVADRPTRAEIEERLTDFAPTVALNNALRVIRSEIAEAVKPLATNTTLSSAILPLASKAEVATAKDEAIKAATNGRPNRSEMNTAIATAKSDLDAKIIALTARVDALTLPPPAET